MRRPRARRKPVWEAYIFFIGATVVAGIVYGVCWSIYDMFRDILSALF